MLESDNGNPIASKPAPSPTNENGPSNEKVVIDPQKGGQVAANDKAAKTITLDPREGQWVWQRLVEVLEVDLVRWGTLLKNTQDALLIWILSQS